MSLVPSSEDFFAPFLKPSAIGFSSFTDALKLRDESDILPPRPVHMDIVSRTLPASFRPQHCSQEQVFAV